ncbi:hypothetical protein N7532_009461 [Penicillium argentinense]|uniref:Fungal STAND N-terminal Goodbye domain-containing protein n=1 Tax=Penicillium argentinense TaxID=1131581 RepID=A0A9W9EZG7_9EURO|nr:uncharacterized protein N7532_009461 [Penicillium argentinense]KAJ5090777.1 hypothetical protein N7532_009461 [Penicillium argentinense]
MHFRCLKFRKKDKASPEDNEHGDTIPNPSEQPEAAVTQVLLPPKEPGESAHAEPSPPPDQQLSSPVSAPLGPALADNEEIQQIWAEIQEKVNSLAQQAGRSVNTGMDIGDVMGTLASTEHPGMEPSKRDAVKNVFGNTLKVIRTVGGFVADGASQVFPAAAQCYNAIGFVINAWEGYQSAFDGLTDLFDECTKYLTRLGEIYAKGTMSESLTKLTAKQLKLFVTICDHAISLRHTSKGKLKAALKIAFLGESSIQDLVGQMAKHVNEEHILISAHTFLNSQEAVIASRSSLKVTQKIEGQVSQVQTQVKDIQVAVMKDKEVHEQSRTEAVIKKALGYNHDIAPVWSDRYRDYTKERLPSTGKWVFDDPMFARWKKGQSGANILAVTGGSGTGKSFLATSIIQHFIHRANPAEATDTRASAAFYYLEGDEVKSMQSASNIDDVAKSLVWQFTVADARYKRSAAGICREHPTADVAAMSQRLLFECPYLHEVNGMFYIIIDGLVGKMGEGMLRFLRDITAAATGRRIRVLMTCDPDCSEHLAQVDGIAFDSIQINAKNKPDVQALIESRMNSMPALNDCTNASVRDLRKSVCDELIEKTGHDYVRVNFALHEISKQEYPEKILSIVHNAGRQRTQQIKEEIEELERSLSDAEISEINDIILWIQHHRGLLTESWMTTALCARDGKKSLLRLSDKFKAKYTLFTITHRGEVTFRAPEVEKAIHRRHRARNEPEQLSPTAISQSEVDMINHFLRTVCPPNTYSKLNVDALLAQKQQSKGGTRICQDDSHTGDAKLALTCLELLANNADEQENGLLPYARKFFDRHLCAADLAFVDIELKVQIGQLLVNLFTHDASIDALLCTRESSRFSPVRIEISQKLLLESNTANTVIQWLRDSAVTSAVADKETKEWISDVIKGGGHGKLLAPAAKRMAFHLVREPHKLPVTRGAFLFIVYYIRKFENGDEHPEAPDPFTASIEEIDSVDQWCANILGISKRDSFWHSQIAAMLLACNKTLQAMRRARTALNIDSNNWRASTLLANKLKGSEGIAMIKPVIDRVGSDAEWQKCDLNRSEYSTMFFILAEKTWQQSQKQFNATVEFAKSAIRIEPTNYPRDARFLQLCAHHKQWLRYVELLETIADSSNALEEQALSELMILCVFDMNRTEQLPLMLQAAFHTGRLEFIVDAFRDCVEKLEARGDRARLCYIRYYYGRGLNALQNGSPKAIEQWRKAIEEGAGPELLSSLISNITPYYLQKAIKAAAANDDEAASIYLEKIQTLLPEDVPESSVMLPPAIYIVRYHARKGDLAQAKLIARDIVRKGIEILTDDIEDNDLPAYNELLWLFIALGDKENVKAIRSLIAARFREHQRFICSGDCGGSWDMADEMIWCQDCINVKFENGCHGKLHETGFPFLFCNSTHKFLRLPKVESPQDGYVLIGDDAVPVDEWMQRIQSDYIELGR